MRNAAITTLGLIPIFIGALWLWDVYRIADLETTTLTQDRELYWALFVAIPISLFTIHRKLLAMLFVSLLVSGTVAGLALLGCFVLGIRF